MKLITWLSPQMGVNKVGSLPFCVGKSYIEVIARSDCPEYFRGIERRSNLDYPIHNKDKIASLPAHRQALAMTPPIIALYNPHKMEDIHKV